MLRPTLAALSLAVLPTLVSPQEPATATSAGLTQAELEELAASLQTEIEILRGAKFTEPVDVALADAASFRTYVTLRMQRMMPPDRLAAEEDAYKLLGLLPPDLSYMQTMMGMLESQVGGFYDPGENRFYLMSSFSGGLAKVILAHELTHALDDQRWDLDERLAARLGNSDALFAFQAVVEGSGMVVMNRWAMQNSSHLSLDEFREIARLQSEGLGDVPPALWKPLLAAYTRGAAFLANSESAMTGSMSAPDPERIDAAFENPPVSSEQILHPAKYWDEREDPVQLDIEVGALPEGVRVLSQDVLGEIGCTLFTEKISRRRGLRSELQAMQTKYTSKAGEGWGGDRLVLVGRGNARALVWWSVWDTVEDAQEFAEAAQGEVLEHVGVQLGEWSKQQGLEGAGTVTFGPATDLDPERGLRLVSSIGFSAEELAQIEAALVVARRAPVAASAPADAK